MSHPRASIQRRFLWPFAGAVLVGTLMAWLFATWLYAGTLERRLTTQLGQAADVLAQGRVPLTPEVLDGLARLLRADIDLRGGSGEVLYSTANPLSPAARSAGHSPWTDPGRHSARVERTLDPERDPRYAAVALAADLSDIRAATRSSAAWFAAGAAVLILGLTWVAHRIGRTIARPIASLALMADAIATGDRGTRVPVERADEIGALAHSLNAMAERLERYELELAESNRLAALGTVSARIAHEIRNPLTAIKLQIQLLGESLPDSQRPIAQDLGREIARLELVVSGVLHQARPQSADLRLQPVNAAALTSELANLFAPQLTHRGIRLDLDLPQDLPLAHLDAERFKQVAVNLLVNARDALPQGGIIRLAWSLVADELVFDVDDSGPGIAAESLRCLNQAPVSRKPDGLGLGLRLSREIAEAHGGRLQLLQSPLGGLRARVSLPLGEAPT